MDNRDYLVLDVGKVLREEGDEILNGIVEDCVNVLIQRTTACDVCGLDSKPLSIHGLFGPVPPTWVHQPRLLH